MWQQTQAYVDSATFTDPPPPLQTKCSVASWNRCAKGKGTPCPALSGSVLRLWIKKVVFPKLQKSPLSSPRTQSPHLCLPPDSFLPHIPHLNTFRVLIFPIPLLLGLDVDGIYRVSGNLAVVQKLRFLVDRGERTWEEVMNGRIGYLRTKRGSEGGSRNCMSQLLVSSRACYRTGSHL